MLIQRLDRAWVNPGPDKGWSWFVLFAGWIVNAGTFGLSTSGCAGVLFSEFLRVYGISREEAMWPFSIMGVAQCIAGGLTSLLCNYLSRRTLLIISSMSCSLAFILCYWSSSFIFTAIVFGCLFGIGVGLSGTIAGVLVCQYFRKYITTATGLSYTGAPVAGFILPVVLTLLIGHYGLGGAMLLTGGLILHLNAASILLRPRTARHFPSLNPDAKHRLLARCTSNNVPVLTDVPQKKLKSVLRSYGQILTEPMFIIVTLHSVLCINHLISVSLTLTDYVMDNGISRDRGVILLSVFAGGDVIGRIFSGLIADRGYLKRRTIAGINLLVMGLCTFVLTSTTNYVVLSISVAVIGLMEGSANILINVLYRQYLGMDKLTTALSCRLFFNGIVSIIRPFLVGVFRDALGSYDNFYYLVGSITIGGGLLWSLEPYFTRRKPYRSAIEPPRMAEMKSENRF